MVYDPLERAAASDLLCHEYILSVPEGGVVPVAAPPATSSSSYSSSLVNPGAALSTNALNANELYYAAKLAGGAHSNGTAPAAPGASLVDGGAPSESMQTDTTSTAADGDAGGESINSKDVLRNRRTDIPNTTTKVR